MKKIFLILLFYFSIIFFIKYRKNKRRKIIELKGNFNNNIILVSTGVFQKYIVNNIEQLIEIGFKNIHVITEKEYFKNLSNFDIKLVDTKSLNTRNFDTNSKLSEGFWHNCSKRFFLIYEYMKKNNIINVIHLENDVLLYNDIFYNLDEKIYLTMDNQNRCIPGILYIPNYNLLTNLILNYDTSQDDMKNLSSFYHNNNNIVKTFPIIDNSMENCIYNENFSDFGSIFDGAAIGQYLGGIDPIHVKGDSSGFINETCEVKYNKYKFEWIKKGDNYFPHINIDKNLIPINNLHIHSKRLLDFRINNPIENEYIKKTSIQFITGEKIQFVCDHFIGTEQDFNYNPNVNKYKNKFIFLGVNEEVDNKPLIFCYTHLLENIDILINTLKKMKNPFKLVFHNSDHSFNEKDLILFEKLPLLIHIYSQNLNINNIRVSYLPIGMANSQWAHGNADIHYEIYNKEIEKSKHIYFNFNTSTNKSKREICLNILKNKGLKWLESLPYREYLLELKKHKYAICPEGNGLDTHRFWECLYMNTIPICIRNNLTEYYAKYFPIILLNNWEALNINNLNNTKKINNKFLDMDYQNYELIFDKKLFDIVICVGPNDRDYILRQIEYTKKNIIGYRNIYLICSDPSINIKDCIIIDENIFPFNINTVSNFHGKSDRNGWYLQQLLKLYAGQILPNILSKYLVIDADTIFLRPTTFINREYFQEKDTIIEKCLYNLGTEPPHGPYFDHMKRLDKDFKKISEKSGISHHMIFETKYVKEIINKIEKQHHDCFYNVFLKEVSEKDFLHSGASEYEIYFNFIFKNHKDKIKIRELKWVNSGFFKEDINLDYISVHHYLR